MKIWKAELILGYDKDLAYKLRFIFEKQKDDYEVNKYTKNEWVYSHGWLCESIPMNMIVENSSYLVIKVIQGFDYELNDEELKKLENEMRKTMIKRLEADKEIYLSEYKRRLEAIQMEELK